MQSHTGTHQGEGKDEIYSLKNAPKDGWPKGMRVESLRRVTQIATRTTNA